VTMIYIGNLSDDSDAAQMRALFERYGAIASLRITPAGSRHRFDGFGLIEMEECAARKAIGELDGLLLDRAILSVREATEAQQPKGNPAPAEPMVDGESLGARMRRRCELTEVEKVDGPYGADGDDWYRYVLGSGTSRITGFHRGTLAEVTEYAAVCAEDFNLRSTVGKSSRALAYSKKK